LGHKSAWHPVTRKLAIHRHTLRHRISAVEALLGLDLEQFADRAELWAPLQLAPASSSSPGTNARRT
jgi:PucR family transcriptional regulator, purine catabolism regulatory protein